MAWNGTRKCGRWLAAAVFVMLTTACGEKDPVTVNPDVSPLVGDWAATSMVVTSVANPEVSQDIIQLGASFTINVQPSGQYTAILIFAQQTSTEIGFLSVSGNVVTMDRTFPNTETSTATYTLTGSRLTLDGDTEYDFNGDKTAEDATAHIVLERQ